MGKSFVLSISLGTGCYRHIQISEDATLDDLHHEIMCMFDFDDDHLYQFCMDNRLWGSGAVYMCQRVDYLTDELGYTDEVELGELSIGKGSKFVYVFDFGDCWVFQIKVLRIVDETTPTPKILKSVGEVSQYGDDEDEDEDDEF